MVFRGEAAVRKALPKRRLVQEIVSRADSSWRFGEASRTSLFLHVSTSWEPLPVSFWANRYPDARAPGLP